VIVIADEYVDMAFGTGALKITPAHDPNDYEIGKKFNLPLINIMNKDASINEIGGPYAGLDRFDCRNKLWDDMTEVRGSSSMILLIELICCATVWSCNQSDSTCPKGSA
jgi:valyl-tRNA synthetase